MDPRFSARVTKAVSQVYCGEVGEEVPSFRHSRVGGNPKKSSKDIFLVSKKVGLQEQFFYPQEICPCADLNL